jgi:hypothetical protein
MMNSPGKGDLIQVDWVDIAEDPVGDPNKAQLARRTSYGLFWEIRHDGAQEVLVTTTTVDRGSAEQSGYCIYPLSCVVKLSVIKKRKGGKKERKLGTTDGCPTT